jgi:transposase
MTCHRDQQAQRWYQAGVFGMLLRLAKRKKEQPTAAIFDRRAMQSTPESDERAGYDGYKHKKGSKIHLPVNTLGYLLALKVTPANKQERNQVRDLAAKVQQVTGGQIKVAFMDQAYTAEQPKQDAQEAGIELVVVKVAEARKGWVLLPRRWVVERSFGQMARFRRLVRDDERVPETLAKLHFVAFAMLMLAQFTNSMAYIGFMPNSFFTNPYMRKMTLSA